MRFACSGRSPRAAAEVPCSATAQAHVLAVTTSGRRDRHRAHALRCVRPEPGRRGGVAAEHAVPVDGLRGLVLAVTVRAAGGARSTDRRRPGRGPRAAGPCYPAATAG